MNPVDNPYRPGAGIKPLTLAGREDELKKAAILLQRVKKGNPQRSLIFYGLRGVGKTVLLNEIQEIAHAEEFLYEHIEISENDDFKKVIAQIMRKILLRIDKYEKIKDKIHYALGMLKAFTFTVRDINFSIDVDAIKGAADSGNFQTDLIELMLCLGSVAKDAGKNICLFFDEAQYLAEDEFEALIAASHRISQKNLPIVIIGAGLPQLAKLSGEAKSYAERLFEFISINNLDSPSAKNAITGPIQSFKIVFSDEAIQEVLKITEGYPYFLQEMGKQIWDILDSDMIDLKVIEEAKTGFFQSLDNSFFKVRYDRSTESERLFMKAMAELGEGPYQISDVSKKLSRTLKSLGPTRANLIHKGFIFSQEHGYISFTVPQFNSFIKRV